MSPQRVRSFSLPVLMVVAGVAACDDGTSPGDLGDLDPAALNGALTGLVQPLNASREVTDNLLLAYPDLEEDGVEFARPGAGARLPLATRVGLGGAFSAAPAAVTFPEGLEGTTFVYDPDVPGWEPAEGRTDAPADGIRVDWYQLDATGAIRMPLTVHGFADLTPGELGGMEALEVVAVETAGEADLEVLDFLQAADVTGGTQWSELIRLDGTYSDSDGDVTFSVFSDGSGDDDAGTQEYEFEGVVANAEVRYEVSARGSQEGTSVYEDRVTATAVFDGSTTVLDLTFTGTADGEDVTGTLVHGDELLANVSSTGNRYTFTAPEGGEFSAADTTELNDLFRSMLLIGFQPLLNLPLHFL